MQGVPSADGGDLLEEEEGGFFAEINITPLTDVFLVLLIILMVVSSSVIEKEKEDAYEKGRLAERALQVMTPEGAGAEAIEAEDVLVSVLPDGTLFLDDQELSREELSARLAELGQGETALRVVLRGDREADYDLIMDVISRCTDAGLTNIALASRQ